MANNPLEIKERIVSIFRRKGPSLPVHIAKEINLSILFASAFLSELLSEKTIKISNMKVGGSPIYFIPGQEQSLEKYSSYLKNKEKEAFLLLKQKKFLQDSKQTPAIRVALRAIKDFAFPFKKDEEIYWRFFTVPESEFKEESKEEVVEKKKEIKEEVIVTKVPARRGQDAVQKLGGHETKKEEKTPIKKEKDLGILEEKEKPKTKKKIIKKKVSKKEDDNFFNKIKEFLSQKSIDILDIESFNRKDLTLKINVKGKEEMLIGYNKKRLTETDIIKAHKKTQELNLKYQILSLGEPSKKLKEFIEAIKDLSDIGKVE